MPRCTAIVAILIVLAATSCARPAPSRRYPLKGQVVALQQDRHEITVRHEDIVGFMPAMTMSYPVSPPSLMSGLAAGDLISATLEVQDAQGRLVEVTKTGTAPMPQNPNQTAMATRLLGEGDPVPEAAFIDQNDQRRSFADWKGTFTLVTFMYTTCPTPTFCPLMDQNFATIQGALKEDAALKGQVKLVSISFDPVHDTPAALKAHAVTLGADPAIWTWLTGDEITIDKFAGHFGVAVIRPDQPGEITHNQRTTLVGRDGRVLKIYSGNDWTPGTVLSDLRAAVKTP
ncbi:MAG: SCO family protein [Vicinamibacterales bacterium]